MDSFALQLPLLALLLAGAAFFAVAEMALFGLSKLQRRRLEKDGDLRGRLAARLLAEPARLLGGILLGNTFIQVAFAALTTELALSETDTALALLVTILGSTAALLLVGEVAPKVIAAASPIAFARIVARPLGLSLAPLGAVSSPLERLSRFFAGALLSSPPAEAAAAAPKAERDVMEHLADFQETTARQVMTPRADILAGDLAWPPERIRQFVRKARTSRLPFYRGNLDNVEGILPVKRFLLAGLASVGEFLEPPYFIPEGKKLGDLLEDFQAKDLDMAIVLDEHGQTTGLVTREDLLEEIFGEVYDEGEPDESAIVAMGEGAWRVQGRALLSEVETEIGLSLEADEGIDTLGGLVMNYLGEIPKRGDSFILSNHTFTISKVAQHRVREVLIQRLAREAPRAPEAASDAP